MNSPADVQRSILRRQLKQAVSLSKPLTIHTREADEDIELILKEELPKNHRVCRFSAFFLGHPDPHKIHVHCFTDTPALAHRLLTHFPNLYIGVTGE
jgi:TatD DNase family protein